MNFKKTIQATTLGLATMLITGCDPQITIPQNQTIAQQTLEKKIEESTEIGIFSSDANIRKFQAFEQYSVEQIFRDAHGYRIFYTDKDNIVLEKTFLQTESCDLKDSQATGNRVVGVPKDVSLKFRHLDTLPYCVRIIKDLDASEKPVANVIHFELGRTGTNFPATYVEVHLHKDQKLSPGIDQYTTGYGKGERTHLTRMSELK